MINLQPGGNTPLPHEEIMVQVITGKPADVSCFRVYEEGKTKHDADFVFYGQKSNDDNTITLSGGDRDTAFQVNMPKVKSDVSKISFTVTVDSGTITNLGSVTLNIKSNNNVIVSAEVPMSSREESALILGELYKRNNEWKFRFVGQGFNGGLKPLCEHFGVDITDDAPPPVPTPPKPKPKKINLSKVTLDKRKPSISLEKEDGKQFGQIKVNLNWDRSTAGKGLFSGFGSNNAGIDLDLGAFVLFKNGDKSLVQALGNQFGSLNQFPFMQLDADDRTGAMSDGEWLRINGEQWDEIDQIQVFSFIYEGVPNWQKTNGQVSIQTPGQPPIETFLTEGNDKKGFCVIATLKNENNSIKVERVDRYFKGHREADKAFSWGFRWSSGSK